MPTEIINQMYNVSIYFPMNNQEIACVHRVADKYGASSYQFLGSDGMGFSFGSGRKARGFIRDARGLDFVTGLELARQRREKIPIRPIKKKI